jgi:hypothetical protein
MTQRLVTSSRAPGLRFPPLKSATPDSEERDRKGNQGRVREEGGKSAPAKDIEVDTPSGWTMTDWSTYADRYHGPGAP